ncbi:hypothetical protein FDI32_gp16 [Acinetobacter phage vB_AbaP_B5]|uniref:Uncharacterized protein n=1 Tax=Acinetobacter phage vB_AbaP_B5 TaxID=2678937 RepID=A0A221SBP4_9CAUD|nr:hypothetical protein FDI32_gp16 [Acinetobacter phage vB_AbaP_B5]ASN73424.1 hypothetical protein B5_16 [Acinetobacter phage vB_AbaP_B5]
MRGHKYNVGDRVYRSSDSSAKLICRGDKGTVVELTKTKVWVKFDNKIIFGNIPKFIKPLVRVVG